MNTLLPISKSMVAVAVTKKIKRSEGGPLQEMTSVTNTRKNGTEKVQEWEKTKGFAQNQRGTRMQRVTT